MLTRLSLKIPPPIIGLVCAVIMWLIAKSFASFDSTFEHYKTVALFMLGIGLAIDLLALYKFIRRKTTINPMSPDSATSLVDSGIYNYTRNPMYLGLLMILSAWAVYLANSLAFLVLPLFIFYITRFQIIPEEIILLDKFGSKFSDYQSRVRRWI